MSRRFFLFGRTHEPAGSDRVALSSQPEERLNKALASLRRLDNYRQNPMTLTEAIEQARYAAEAYRQWRESGAFIRDIVLRVSNSSEIKIDKATPDNTNRFGFRFTSKFPRGSALNFYKQADKEFREVLLYSIDLDKIPASGHSYAKTYENGQTLMLEIEPGLSGQFNVSVDYTMPPDAADITPSRRERLSKHLPLLRRAAVFLLLVALVSIIIAIQKRDSINVPTGAAASGTSGKVDTATAITAGSPQTPVDDRVGQSNPAGLNAKENSGSPNAQSEYQQFESPALGVSRAHRLPDAATTRADRHREMTRDAVGTRASTRKPKEAEQLQQEPTRRLYAAPAESKSSDLGETKNSGAILHIVQLEAIRRADDDKKVDWKAIEYQSDETNVDNRERRTTSGAGGTGSRLKRNLDRADKPGTWIFNTTSPTKVRGKNKIPVEK